MFEKFANWLVYDIINLSPTTKFAHAIHFFIYDTVKILFLLCIIITIIAYIRSYIDNEKIKKYIERQPKLLAHVFAAVFGAITPFCSCSSIPIFIGFAEAGIPFGVAMSFLITSPIINEVAVVLLAGTIGWKITAIYIITGITVGTLGGILMEKFGWKQYLQDYLHNSSNTTKITACCSGNDTVHNSTTLERIYEAYTEAKDLFKRIWLFVVVGIGIGAFLHGYVPQEFFMQYLNGNALFTVPLTVLLGIPLYADATTIIPIARVLLDKGVAVGTVLVFMMAIVALSLPELIILTKVMKKKLIIRFVAFMFFTLTSIGYFYNMVL